ncbi:MAG: ion channel [Balneola sp.]
MVTLTTVGYGDISPSTSIGLMFAVLILIFGYVIIAVPTGIVTVELGKVSSRDLTTEVYHFSPGKVMTLMPNTVDIAEIC